MALPNGYVLDGSNSTDTSSSGGSVPPGYVLDGQSSTSTDIPLDPINKVVNEYKTDKAIAGVVSDSLPWNQVKQGLVNAGGDIASAGGYAGARIANGIPELGIPPSPKIGATIQGAGVLAGSVPAIGPDILSAYAGIRGIFDPENAATVGLRKSPKDLQPQYSAQNTAAGISNAAPESADEIAYKNPYEYPSQLTKPKYVNGQPVANPGGAPFSQPRVNLPADNGVGAAQPLPGNIPIQYPKDPGTLINNINNTMNLHGENVPLQQLQDYHELLSSKMRGIDPEIPKGSPNYARATKTRQRLTSAINNTMDPILANKQLPPRTLPTRTALNQAASIAYKKQAIADFIKHYSGATAKVAATVGGIGSGIYEMYKHLNGDQR